jgi:hypothetical protein
MSILKRLTDSESEFLLGLIADTPPPTADGMTSGDPFGDWSNFNNFNNWDNFNNWTNWNNWFNTVDPQ